MPNYTTNLNLEKPTQSEQYNINVFNANADKIDQFAGQVPTRALTADKLTTGAKINGVNFKGDADIVTGAGFYYNTVTYGAGDLAFIYNQDGALELHKSLNAGNVGHNPLTSTGYWEKQDLGGSGGRNVGEIIQSSLPLIDAGLHLLDGTRLSGDGIYGEFVQYIADLYAENPSANYFTTESTWQSSITNYGSCGKFVYDSTLNTVRLPKVSDILQGTTDVNALGDLVQAGLPVHTHTRGNMNITGRFWVGRSANAAEGAFVKEQTSGEYSSKDSASDGGHYLFDASRSWTGSTSNPNYANPNIQNSSTVQPQTIKVLYYIVVATSTKTEVEVDIDEIATDLNGKADTSLSNITTSGKEVITGADKPDYANYSSNYVNNTEYTASADMWVIFTSEVTVTANIYGNPSGAAALGQINGGVVYHNAISVAWDGGGNTVANSQRMSIMYRLYKNDKFRLDTSVSNQASVSAQIYTYPIVS